MKKAIRPIILLLLFTGAGIVAYNMFFRKKSAGAELIGIQPSFVSIATRISTAGTVRPQNRLEIMPPISGRIEQILVQEGDHVKAGQTLAWMSSTERAALIDAARSKGPEALSYWENVYKPAPLIAPIDGEVIVRFIEPGQTVNQNTPILVLSDRLIVLAMVDEADIGKIKTGQKTYITLNAYPDKKVAGEVRHISYESKIINNVIMYEVTVIPDFIPDIFRSGMGADVQVLESVKENILAIPLEAVLYERDGTYVLAASEKEIKPVRKKVKLGIFDDRNIEVISGITESDTIYVSSFHIDTVKRGGETLTSPLAPTRTRRAGLPGTRR